MIKHRHNFKRQSVCGNEITFKCSCGELRSRKMTKEEYKYSYKTEFDSYTDVHHTFHKIFKNLAKRNIFDADSNKFLISGYKLIQTLEKLAEKYPEDILVSRCDDDSFMTSKIFYFLHRAEYSYMGATCLVVSQNGDNQSFFFLYPHHVDSQVEVLKKLINLNKTLKSAGKAYGKSIRPKTLDRVKV